MTQTNNVGRAQRKSLATEIDRLDNILDGLDEALAGAVEMAVRDVVGQAVKQAVEATIKEVLSNPELIRAALANHAPVATPLPQQTTAPRRTLKDWLKEKAARLYEKASEKAAQAKRNLGSAWSWCVEKLCRGCSWAWFGMACAWKFRKTTAVGMIVGSLVGVGAYFSGPEVASALCGLAGTMMTVAGAILWPLCRLLVGGNDDV